ncbi:hypothetical protein HJFPF1_04100 [Paramyrothecium foliicola]|nr:hypothetical protein HJFPF1_04100 [Paramyrothecium foliicola]
MTAKVLRRRGWTSGYGMNQIAASHANADQVSPIPRPPTDPEVIAQTCDSFTFDSFTADDAWELGHLLYARLIPFSKKMPVLISIVLASSGQTLFQACLGSTTIDNEHWVRRKRNTVLRWGKSSWWAHCFWDGDEDRFRNLFSMSVEQSSQYAIHGGAVPIRVQGVEGVVAVVGVSAEAKGGILRRKWPELIFPLCIPLAVALKSGVTPTVSTHLSKSTSTDDIYDIEIIEAYLDPKVVDQDDLQLTRLSYVEPTAYTIYEQPIVITGPTSDQITPISYETEYITRQTGDRRTRITAYLPKAISIDTQYYSSLYTYYASRCRDFDFKSYNRDADSSGSSNGGSGSRGNGRYGDDDDNDGFLGDSGDLGVCSLVAGCTMLRTWVIVVISLACGVFVLGFFKSYFWFRRLMQGRTALRLGTVYWILVTWLTLCLTRMAKARSKDQERLREQWRSISFGRRMVLWLKWGFRWTYSVESLGDSTSSRTTARIEEVKGPDLQAITVDNKMATSVVY